MDLRRLRKGEWITAISGIALFVSLFLPWEENGSGWEVHSVTDILLAVLAVAAIATWAINAFGRTTAPGIASQSLTVPLALVMGIAMLVKVWGYDDHGAWIGLGATFGVLGGVLVGMRDERLSKPGRPTDQTGVPVSEPLAVEKLPGPPPA